MRIKNIGGLSSKELINEIAKGARIIRYPYTISLLVITLQRKSGGNLVLPGENANRKRVSFILLSALFGWWGIPNGPKQTLKSIRTNLQGGRDVTQDVLAILEGKTMFKEFEMGKR